LRLTTPLDPWICAKISAAPGRLRRAAIESYQIERLRQIIHWARNHSAFYRNHLQAYPQELRSLQDFQQYPFTTDQDVREHSLQMVCVSQSEIERVVTLTTSGTTGAPKRLFFTRSDQDLTVDFFQHGMSTFTHAGDRVLILLPGERVGSVGELLARGLRRIEAIPEPYGPVKNPFEVLDILQSKRINCLVGAPTHVLALARFWQQWGRGQETLDQRGGRETHDQRVGVRRFSTSETLDQRGHTPDAVLLSTDRASRAIRQAIEQIWGCKVYDHYGMTEMGLGGGVECQEQNGYHLREADLFFEIIDPHSGETLPDGEYGEVVFSTLTRVGMPLLRYRTNDFSRFIPDPCECGTVLKRLEGIRFRIAGRLWLGDPPSAPLCMADLDEALFALPWMLNFSAELHGAVGNKIASHNTLAMTESGSHRALAMIESGSHSTLAMTESGSHSTLAMTESGSQRALTTTWRLYIGAIGLPQRVSSEESIGSARAEIAAALESIPAVHNNRLNGSLDISISVAPYEVDRAGSLAKRTIRDFREVKDA